MEVAHRSYSMLWAVTPPPPQMRGFLFCTMQDQKQQQSPRPFKVGDRVISKRFGEGVVIEANGKFSPWPVTVEFVGSYQSFTEIGIWASLPSPRDIQHAEPEPEKN